VPSATAGIVDRIVDELHAGAAAVGESGRDPGEGTLERRRESLASGVPVDDTIWREIGAL
jgi:LDH2 family malate/lactate/ureidoglycolate dehydrogenase